MGLKEKFIEKFKKKKTDKEPSLKMLTSDVGRQGANLDALAQGKFNPDDIGIATYKHMFHTDAQIKAAFSLIRLALLSRRWKVTSLEASTEVVDYIKYNFEHVDSRINGVVSNILTSVLYGFSVSEIVWNLIDEGKYKGKIGLDKIKTLDPESITFDVDIKGNLKRVLQARATMSFEKPIILPLAKLIIHTENKEFGNYYGNSRLRSIYKNWFIKENLLKFWNIALERWGQPLVIGTVPTKDDLTLMKSILDNLQNKSSIAKTEGWDIAALETGIGRSSGGDYSDAIKYHNAQMLKGMLVPQLMIDAGQGGGSFALGQTQFDIFTIMIQNLENDIAGIVENFLIKPLVTMNFGDQKSFPEFQYEPLTKQELFNLARTFALLVKNGVVGADEQFMRDMMSLPHRDAAEAGPSTISDTKSKTKVPVPPPETQVQIRKDGDKTKGSQQIKTPKAVAKGLTRPEPRG